MIKESSTTPVTTTLRQKVNTLILLINDRFSIGPGLSEPTLVGLCSPRGSAGRMFWLPLCPGRPHGRTGSSDCRRGRGRSDRPGDGPASPEQGRQEQRQPGSTGTPVNSAASWPISDG